jgi:outer membrane lipoprotein carrier protein
MRFMTTKGSARRGILLIGILFCSAALLGWANNWEEIQRESSNIRSVSAQFSQEKHMHILTKAFISKGHFFFRAPDSVRWEYTSPVKSVLLMRKGDIKKYTLGRRGFVEDSGDSLESMQIVLQEISKWSRGQFTENEHFSATLKGGKVPKIILTPKEKGLSAMISRIVLTLSPDRRGVISSVKIIEDKGNYTLFEFTDVQVNVEIPETIFREVE